MGEGGGKCVLVTFSSLLVTEKQPCIIFPLQIFYHLHYDFFLAHEVLMREGQVVFKHRAGKDRLSFVTASQFYFIITKPKPNDQYDIFSTLLVLSCFVDYWLVHFNSYSKYTS